jgi:hypothetical protein
MIVPCDAPFNGRIKMSSMNYYFTFGQSHTHPQTDEPLKDYWVEVLGVDYGEARALMFQYYGAKWSFQYNEHEFERHWFPKGCYEVLPRKEQNVQECDATGDASSNAAGTQKTDE